MKRLILEMGTGTDLYGGDYTKAACRAVRDAIGHSSLSLFRSCGYNHRDMVVKVTIGVQDPGAVDVAQVADTLPRGNPEVTVVPGGLNIDDSSQDTPTVIASAAVEAFLEVDAENWAISGVADG
ncbi:MAG: Lin0512 family protein [Pseudomonadota bacterium]|nr:Lin0512 family protein [Pseudomonadota bacterium]